LSKSQYRNRGSRTWCWHYIICSFKLNFFLFTVFAVIIIVNHNRSKLLPETAHFTERLLRVHPKSLGAVLPATVAEVRFKNYLLRLFAYLTARIVSRYNNTLIAHDCLLFDGAPVVSIFQQRKKMTLKRCARR